MRDLWKRFIEASVWGSGSLPGVPKRFRPIFRWLLPATDIFFIWFGLAGWINGVGTVQAAASITWQENWSGALAIFAFLALIGVLFPKLWGLELIAKGPLVGLFSVYIVVLGARGIDNPLTAATAGLICVLILLPVWRIWDLSGGELRAYRLARKAKKEATR